MNKLIFDIETTGFPRRIGKKYASSFLIKMYDTSRIVSIAWAVCDNNGTILNTEYSYIKPVDFTIDNDSDATKINGITQELAIEKGRDINEIMDLLLTDIESVDTLIAHNIDFDFHILLSELYRYKRQDIRDKLKHMKKYCTMEHGTPIAKIDGKYGYKWPKLTELYSHLFGGTFEAHDAQEDVKACLKCYFKMQN